MSCSQVFAYLFYLVVLYNVTHNPIIMQKKDDFCKKTLLLNNSTKVIYRSHFNDNMIWTQNQIFLKLLQFQQTVIITLIFYSRGISRIWNVSIAGQRVTGLLVEPIPYVGILTLSQSSSGDIRPLIEVVPGDSSWGGLCVGATAAAKGTTSQDQVIVGVVVVQVPIALKTT